jgi:NAD(P)-dependent dehydrogenase (short-subunit alcohol dehydrogenase family)
MENKVWFITGISSGLGKAIAQAAISQGIFVIGTFRNPEQAAEFNKEHKEKALALTLDITRKEDVDAAMSVIASKFPRIDVLVNNAGFGFAGAIEETGMTEARDVFEANFFGTLQVTQAFLPIFRKQRSGHIIQISSHGGFKAFPGFGIYNAAKFALEGFSEALAQEITPLGIKLTIVEPGPFRTGFAGAAFKKAAVSLADYAPTAGAFRERMAAVDGKQEGDPAKAADAILRISRLENPPLRLPLGKIALNSLSAKLDSVKSDMERFRELAEQAVFPAG